jgi:peroxiredoxin
MAKLSAGDRFPDFPVHTANDVDIPMSALLGRADKTIFWALRYVGCTSCRYDIHAIKENYHKFTAKNAQVVVVLQSPPDTIKADLAGDEVPYEIISDPNQRFYKRFSITAADAKEGLRPSAADTAGLAKAQTKSEKVKASGFVHGKYEGDELQLPAFFIVDSTGKTLYSHYAAYVADMPTVDEAVEKL